MSGFKTWIAVIGGIATGIGMIATGLLSDPIDVALIGKGWVAILAALALLGIGHKIEKTRG